VATHPLEMNPKVLRRDFLKTAVAAASSGLLTGPRLFAQEGRKPVSVQRPPSSAGKYDVVVIGAGIAGVIAAVAAGKAGCKTAIIEKSYLPGGLVTVGGVTAYYPLGDYYGNQVVYGLSAEVPFNTKYGGHVNKPKEAVDPRKVAQDEAWQKKVKGAYFGKPFTLMANVNRNTFIITLEEYLQQAGVDIWYDAMGCGAILKGNRITGIEMETTGGRRALEAAIVIDASGTADIAYRAGVPCVVANNQPGYHADYLDPTTGKNAMLRSKGAAKKNYLGVGDDLTAYITDCRKALRQTVAETIQKIGKDNFQMFWMITMSHVRKIRAIVGVDCLRADSANKHLPDSVGVISDWLAPNRIYELPYGIFFPKEIKGLLAAGRSVSVENGGRAWDQTRIIANAALTGEVAGYIAGLCVKHNTVPETLAIKDVQKELDAHGVKRRYEFAAEPETSK